MRLKDICLKKLYLIFIVLTSWIVQDYTDELIMIKEMIIDYATKGIK